MAVTPKHHNADEADFSPVKKMKKKRAAEVEEEEEEPVKTAEPVKKKKKEEANTSQSAKDFLEKHQITVPRDCPKPFQTFEASKAVLGDKLHKALLKQGYEAPTPIQAQCWPILLTGKDFIGVAKTGSGKTCGFLLPALARLGEREVQSIRNGIATPTVLVLAPTRELAQQIAVESEKFSPVVGVKTTCVYGGADKKQQMWEVRKGVHVLIATPGRLNDLCGNGEWSTQVSVSLKKVTYLVLDEADRMLDMGFEPQIAQIVEGCPPSGEPEQGWAADGPEAGKARQTLFFTATWPREVRATAAKFTSQDAIQVRIGQDGDELTANKNVKQIIKMCDEEDKMDLLKEILTNDLKDGETCIVFVGQKAACDGISQEIRTLKNTWSRSIHSDKDQRSREDTLWRFREFAKQKTTKKPVLVATDVAARGLDIPGVALVVIYDFGFEVENYVHRIGRTGRAGLKGKAVTLFTHRDRGAAELVQLLQGAEQKVPPQLEELARMKGKGKGGRKGKGKGGKGKGGKSKSKGWW